MLTMEYNRVRSDMSMGNLGQAIVLMVRISISLYLFYI